MVGVRRRSTTVTVRGDGPRARSTRSGRWPGRSGPRCERATRRRDATVRGGPVPLDGRARPGGDLHRRARRDGVDPLHQPAGRGAARLHARGVDRRTRSCGRACSIPDDRARAIAENERHNETGEPFRLEYRMFHRDGHVVWVHDEATIVRDERGMPRYSHGVMMDISERKRAEEQRRVPGLPRRADRPAEPRRCSRSCWSSRSPGRAGTTAPSRWSASTSTTSGW